MATPEKKLVVKVDVPDDKAKKKAMKTVATLPGIDSISMDMKDKKMTVIGVVDPCAVVAKLRKNWHTEVVTIGPAKEEKKPEPKKEEAKKEETKKVPDQLIIWDPRWNGQYIRCIEEEDPTSCVIC